MKKVITISIMVLSMLVFTVSSEAVLIEIGITAEVTQIDDFANLLEGKINVGDTITGSYKYDSTVLDSNPSSTAGSYWQYNENCGIFLNCNGFSFNTNPDDVEFLIGIGNNHGSQEKDYYVLLSNNILPTSDGIGMETISWQLDDPTGEALSSIGLPVTAPILEDWQSIFGLQITSEKTDHGRFEIISHVTSATLIPEPLSIVIFGCGVFLVGRKKYQF